MQDGDIKMTTVNIMGAPSAERKRRQPQNRTLRTRAALIAAARSIVADQGFQGLRAEVIVARAGTAKGTLFAHFPDMGHLMAVLVAEQLETLTPTTHVSDLPSLIAALGPLFRYLSSQPEIVTVVTRFSGPDGQGLGLAEAIQRHGAALAGLIAALQAQGQCASGDPSLLAEGVLAFVFHTSVSAVCITGGEDAAVHSERLLNDLIARWLTPRGGV